MHLYLIILNDIHSKLPFLRNKFNFVTISFFHFQFRLVSSNPYISYFKSQNNTIYCSLALLHYSASETSGKHIAKRTSTSFLSFITEFTSFPIYRAGFSIFSNISSFKASFLMFLLSFLFNIYKKLTFFSLPIFTKNSCFFMSFSSVFQHEKCCFSPRFCPCVTNLLFLYCAALCIIIHHFHGLA